MRITKSAVLSLSCFALTAGAQEPARAQVPAPVIPGKLLKSAEPIAGQYIVVLRDSDVALASVSSMAQGLAARHGAQVTRTYSHALNGFVVRTNEAGARALAAEPQVSYVVEDGYAYAVGSQSGATWGLDRIDQRDRPLNSVYNYNMTGSGVHAYVIDTGILTTHSDFGGRATGDFTSINDGRGASDCNGHGTHVAGTVGGSTWGVAKNVRLHAVRVLDCNGSGSWSGVIAGLDWVTANHTKPAVANMSLGGGANQAVDDAVRLSIAAGVTYAVAAGNDTADACTKSPARTGEALTVGATDSSDTRPSWSNYGSCVDIFAPGVGITSAYHTGGTASMDGTSMASPHVAGAAALFLQSNPNASPAAVSSALLNSSTGGKIVNAGSGSPNRLLFSAATAPSACGVLFADQALGREQSLSACNGKAVLAHQGDGNVVIYDRLGALWSTNTWGSTTSSFVMQGDGNLVLYSSTGSPLWSSNTYGRPGAYVAMQDDCNLVVYDASGHPLWASYTSCR
ncbi:S8 family serine peptidase [Archangium violaceum]|uniref:S8 family serine peptidase n=1 Tax=Archangium violaceum TaxID=83451 RepID=UPI00193C4BFE|nr:S8 family serine peptidase [Archangium violaceum]QRK10790.1 S8 family serine peptidase [Archangium violaceum]